MLSDIAPRNTAAGGAQAHSTGAEAPAGQAGYRYVDVTEIAGDEVTFEQIKRAHHRYTWAARRCAGRDVLEIACGSGPGLGLILAAARSVIASDYSPAILRVARRSYAGRADFVRLNGERIPLADACVDTIVLFEAIYYFASVEAFVRECRRVLRPGGELLIVTVNKDLYDFNPSPLAHDYYGVTELGRLLCRNGFSAEFFGVDPVDTMSMRQRVLRPVKRLAVALRLIPGSMAGKKWLKRIVFGRLQSMPADLSTLQLPYAEPVKLAAELSDTRHLTLYCVARKENA